MSITLIDSTSSSLTVSWPAVPGAVRYKLEYRKPVSRGDDVTFDTLSDKLTTTQARKRNLQDDDGSGFYFRVGSIVSNDSDTSKSWVTHANPFQLLTADEEKQRMAAPKAALAGNQALLVSWSKSSDSAIKGYELQMRENDGGVPWKTIAPSLSGTEVRKKNLTSKHGYQFRVRPVADGSSSPPFSPASDAVVASGLSDGMKRLFGTLEDGNLLKNPSAKPIQLADALGGKEFVLLYASAHWCGPCRQFSPQLAKWYNSLPASKSVEVVFLSADHDEKGFDSYYSSMPWLAVPFDDDTRENLMGHIRVSGIPRLAVLDGRTGRIIEDNAVGSPLDINRWRRLAAGNK